jgi:hypothetical protein
VFAVLLAALAVTAPAPRCHTAGLAASLAAGSPGAGQRYATLSLRNKGTRACHVFGYAGLQLLDAQHQPLPTTVIRDRTGAPRNRTLRPGARTRAPLPRPAPARRPRGTSRSRRPTR